MLTKLTLRPYLRDLPVDVGDGELQRRQHVVQLRAAEAGDAPLAVEEVPDACMDARSPLPELHVKTDYSLVLT